MMKTTKKLALLLALLAVAFVPAAAPWQQADDEDTNIRITQVDTSSFPEVTFYVSIEDAEGNPVPVDPSRLVIMENGEPIDSEQIEGIEEVGPLTTLLVMDVSGSMDTVGKLDAAKAAAHRYVDQMRPVDQAGLLSFNTQTTVVQPITDQPGEMRTAIDSLAAGGDTSMYDALMAAIDQLGEVQGRKAIIVLTDGMDNSSAATDVDVVNRIGPSGFSISAVGLGVPKDYVDEMEGIDEEALTSLADQAGGVYGYAEDEESLSQLYQTYAAALQSEYAISYTSPAALRDGVNRALTVELTAPGGAAPVANQSEAYNPGGLVPEVAQPAAWSSFGLLLAALVALLFLPTLWNLASERFARQEPEARVTLKERPKIKLKN